jgi:uncharacterized membrane protein
MATKTVTRAALVAAVYVVLTVVLAPLSFGPLQFRISEMLKPLALFAPWFAWAFALGTGLANLWSPFGPWDYVAMPLVDALAAWLCWKLRARPVTALLVQAAVISVGVAVFPLWLGGKIAPWLTILPVLASQIIILFGAWFIAWRPRREWVEWRLRS